MLVIHPTVLYIDLMKILNLKVESSNFIFNIYPLVLLAGSVLSFIG